MTDFLQVADLGAEGLTQLIEQARQVKADPASVAGVQPGLRVGLFFMKPSTRTRISAEVATVDLGGHAVVLRQEEIGLGTRESLGDVARTLARYLDVLALRVFHHRDLIDIAAAVDVPVVNLLSDVEHPCQALADLLTIAEARKLPGTKLAYVGDGNNVCHSLMVAGAMTGMEVQVATPVGYEPDASHVRRAGEVGTVTIGHDPRAAVQGADVVYTDTWTSMGQESEREERRARFAGFTVDAELFGTASDQAIFLHCLPAHRGEEVTDEVMDHPRSRIFAQAENRLHTFKALLLRLVE